MTGLLARLIPGRIATQLVALIVGSVLALHAALTIHFLWPSTEHRHAHPAENTGRIASLVELVDRTQPSERPTLVTGIARAHPQFALVLNPEDTVPVGGEAPERRFLERALDGAMAVIQAGAPDRERGTRLIIILRDGQKLALIAPSPQSGPPVGVVSATLLFVLLSIALFGIWAGRALIRPLEAVAAAAERYDPSTEPRALPEEGPREIRTLAAAFNRMQARIAELVRERTDAFAAVGHDLRTPVTRVRLRAEYIPDERERRRMIDDLDQIDSLIASAMRHLRDEAAHGDRIAFDLATLLQTVADRFADMAQDVPFVAGSKARVIGDPLAIERAVTNLIDNAVRHGGSAHVTLEVEGERAIIDVSDPGPGIAQEEQERLMRPFVRGDSARTMHPDAGFGLGLSIARKIAVDHGGALSFPAASRGFVARISLPLADNRA